MNVSVVQYNGRCFCAPLYYTKMDIYLIFNQWPDAADFDVCTFSVNKLVPKVCWGGRGGGGGRVGPAPAGQTRILD